jgi:hypothetical protein
MDKNKIFIHKPLQSSFGLMHIYYLLTFILTICDILISYLKANNIILTKLLQTVILNICRNYIFTRLVHRFNFVLELIKTFELHVDYFNLMLVKLFEMVIASKYYNLAKIIFYMYSIAFTLVISSGDLYINSIFILHIISLLLFTYIRFAKIELFNKYPLLGKFVKFIFIILAIITGITIVKFIFWLICTKLASIFKSVYDVFFGQGNSDGSGDNGGLGNSGTGPSGPKGPDNSETMAKPESYGDKKRRKDRERYRNSTREQKDRRNELSKIRYHAGKARAQQQETIAETETETLAAAQHKKEVKERRTARSRKAMEKEIEEHKKIEREINNGERLTKAQVQEEKERRVKDKILGYIQEKQDQEGINFKTYLDKRNYDSFFEEVIDSSKTE